MNAESISLVLCSRISKTSNTTQVWASRKNEENKFDNFIMLKTHNETDV